MIEGCVYVDGEPLPNGNLREIFSGFPPGAGLFLAAAQTNEHLATLVRSTPENVLWVGSAGLAAHLARDLDSAAAGSAPADDDRDEPVPDFACSNVVVAVGSQHEQSLRQLALLDSIGPRSGVRIIRLDPRDQAFLEQALPTLAASDGLVLTGGQTARAVLDLLGVGQFEVRGEITSGVPWGTFQRQGREVAVVTKAGGFGDDRILDRAVRFLSRTQ